MKNLLLTALILLAPAARAATPPAPAPKPKMHICIVFADQATGEESIEVDCDGKLVSNIKGVSNFSAASSVLQGVIGQGFRVVGQSEGHTDTTWTLEKDN